MSKLSNIDLTCKALGQAQLVSPTTSTATGWYSASSEAQEPWVTEAPYWATWMLIVVPRGQMRVTISSSQAAFWCVRSVPRSSSVDKESTRNNAYFYNTILICCSYLIVKKVHIRKPWGVRNYYAKDAVNLDLFKTIIKKFGYGTTSAVKSIGLGKKNFITCNFTWHSFFCLDASSIKIKLKKIENNALSPWETNTHIYLNPF